MGDRANVAVIQSAGPVFLYTHWAGSALPGVVQRALAREQRWDDEQYLTRIIFSEMVGDDIAGETGYGIGTSMGDGEDCIIAVDPSTQQVYFAHGNKLRAAKRRLTFTEFVQLKNVSWASLKSGG